MIDYIKIYEEVLLEATKEQLRQQFKNIDEKIFNEIFEADPYNGKYAQWLLKIYELGNLPLEDLYKATEYLNIYHKVKNKLDPKYKNIHQTIAKKVEYVDDFDGQKKSKIEKTQLIKSLQELFQIIKPYKEQNADLSKNEKLKKDNLVYEDEKWEVYIPKTYEASCKLGSGTEWCTATGKTKKHYDNYTKDGKLYILINKKNKKKFQFHFETESFKDSDDDDISLYDFFKKHENIFIKFFVKLNYDKIKNLIYMYINNDVQIFEKIIEEYPDITDNIFYLFLKQYRNSMNFTFKHENLYNKYKRIATIFQKKLPYYFQGNIFTINTIYNANDYIMYNIIMNKKDETWVIFTKFLEKNYDKIRNMSFPFIFNKVNNIWILYTKNFNLLTITHDYFLVDTKDGETLAIYIDVNKQQIKKIPDYENNKHFQPLLSSVRTKSIA